MIGFDALKHNTENEVKIIDTQHVLTNPMSRETS